MKTGTGRGAVSVLKISIKAMGPPVDTPITKAATGARRVGAGTRRNEVGAAAAAGWANAARPGVGRSATDLAKPALRRRRPKPSILGISSASSTLKAASALPDALLGLPT